MFNIDFETFRKYYADPFNDSKYANFLEDTLHVLEEQSFVKEHVVFYPKGMYLDEELTLYFFTDKTLHVVRVEVNQMIVQTWNKSEISRVSLIIPDRYDLGLEIYLKDGEKLELNSKLDTTTNASNLFKKKILEIHKLLTNK